MTLHRSRSFREDANTRVAAYESLLDLFTLISFILILSAVIYAAKSANRSQESSSILAKVATHGSGVPGTLPADELLLVIYRDNSIDKLTIVDFATGSHTFDVSVHNVDQTLNNLSSLFDRAGTINVALYREKEDLNPGIFLAVSRWLAGHGHNKYRVYHAGNPL
jgi:hypothetical protein